MRVYVVGINFDVPPMSRNRYHSKIKCILILSKRNSKS